MGGCSSHIGHPSYCLQRSCRERKLVPLRDKQILSHREGYRFAGDNEAEYACNDERSGDSVLLLQNPSHCILIASTRLFDLWYLLWKLMNFEIKLSVSITNFDPNLSTCESSILIIMRKEKV